MSHEIRNISATGFYLLTRERWHPGTLVTMTLQRSDVAKENSGTEHYISVLSKVVRLGQDGVGFAFVPLEAKDSDSAKVPRNKPVDKRALGRFLEQLGLDRGCVVIGLSRGDCEREILGQDTSSAMPGGSVMKRLDDGGGQALIEYILLLPLVFLLVVNMVNFGGFFFAVIGVANAARAAGDYAIMGGASVASSHIQSVTASQISTLITTDIASLPNNPSLSVNICQNSNGTITVLSGTCTSIKSDPEPASYVLTSIDVTYTYKPLIPLFSFPNLHINATLPTTTIHRQAVMRSIQ